MNERYTGEVMLTYNVSDDRYYIYDGESHVFDIIGKSRIHEAVREYFKIVVERYDKATYEQAIKRMGG